ncbi:hypothetical protein LshimejAT787_2000290 [Lyophyllum shimeji]|uniref:Uncharacterized protein n=1 Tax=Lyophyllum shimeji TaxID=47721 RepID=A0A9P3Q0V5_LYOSH|nr:hypothetical protein LshimejAT787_2000290 [Lyophyllum shimeji]
MIRLANFNSLRHKSTKLRSCKRANIFLECFALGWCQLCHLVHPLLKIVILAFVLYTCSLLLSKQRLRRCLLLNIDILGQVHKFAFHLVQFILGHLFRKQWVRLTTSKSGSSFASSGSRLRSEHLRTPLPNWRLSGTRKNSDRHRHVRPMKRMVGHIPEASPKAAAVSEQIQDARPVIPSKVKGRKLSETQRTISALCLTLCVGDVNKRDLTTSLRASVAFFAWSAVSRTSAPQQFRTCFPTCCALELVVPTTLLVADRGCRFKEGINRQRSSYQAQPQSFLMLIPCLYRCCLSFEGTGTRSVTELMGFFADGVGIVAVSFFAAFFFLGLIRALMASVALRLSDGLGGRVDFRLASAMSTMLKALIQSGVVSWRTES